jgi:hypothetical protein
VRCQRRGYPLEPPPTKYVDTLVTRPLAEQPGTFMESTLSTVLFFVAILGGPLVAGLLTFSIRRRATWQLFLAVYLGEILCTETFRMWHLSRLRAWLPSGQLPIPTNRPSPSLPLRLLSDLAPAFVVGGIVLGVCHWLRAKTNERYRRSS